MSLETSTPGSIRLSALRHHICFWIIKRFITEVWTFCPISRPSLSLLVQMKLYLRLITSFTFIRIIEAGWTRSCCSSCQRGWCVGTNLAIEHPTDSLLAISRILCQTYPCLYFHRWAVSAAYTHFPVSTTTEDNHVRKSKSNAAASRTDNLYLLATNGRYPGSRPSLKLRTASRTLIKVDSFRCSCVAVSSPLPSNFESTKR